MKKTISGRRFNYIDDFPEHSTKYVIITVKSFKLIKLFYTLNNHRSFNLLDPMIYINYINLYQLYKHRKKKIYIIRKGTMDDKRSPTLLTPSFSK